MIRHFRTTPLPPTSRAQTFCALTNNWSTKGNINPYTGKAGTKLYPPYGYGGSGYGAGGVASGGYSYPSLSEEDQHRRKVRRRRQTIFWGLVGAVLIYGMVQEANSSPY